MTLADRVRSFLPFLKAKPRLQADQVRGLLPTRNPAVTWSREGNENLVTILAPLPPAQGLRKALARFVGEPAAKRIELSDQIASDVWELCDGKRSVKEICREVAQKYKMGERETEVSVLTFLNMLRSRRLVGVPVEQESLVKTGNSPNQVLTDSKSVYDGNSNSGKSRRTPKRARRR